MCLISNANIFENHANKMWMDWTGTFTHPLWSACFEVNRIRRHLLNLYLHWEFHNFCCLCKLFVQIKTLRSFSIPTFNKIAFTIHNRSYLINPLRIRCVDMNFFVRTFGCVSPIPKLLIKQFVFELLSSFRFIFSFQNRQINSNCPNKFEFD